MIQYSFVPSSRAVIIFNFNFAAKMMTTGFWYWHYCANDRPYRRNVARRVVAVLLSSSP